MRIGRIRVRLAQMIQEAIPEITVEPSALMVIPDPQGCGLARWSGTGRLRAHPKVLRSICSWDRMSDCVHKGFTVDAADPRIAYADYELHAKEG